MPDARMIVDAVVSEMFEENTFIAHLEGRNDCVVVDPGFDAERVIEHIKQNDLEPAAIFNTHGHADHIAGNTALKRRWPDCPLIVGARDAPKLTDPTQNLSAAFGIGLTSPPADRLVHHGETVAAAGMDFEIIETPGHSAGHIVLLWKGESPWIVFGGDMLIQGAVGRTDFPDGNLNELVTSIRTRLYTLPDDTRIMLGHGSPTTIGHEKQHNAFVRP